MITVKLEIILRGLNLFSGFVVGSVWFTQCFGEYSYFNCHYSIYTEWITQVIATHGIWPQTRQLPVQKFWFSC